jgi:hypothetical protein
MCISVYVLISNRFRSAITDFRALRGPDFGSDHNLLKINFKVKLRVKTGNKYNEKIKIVNVFQNSRWKQEIEINNRFDWQIWTMKMILKKLLMKSGKALKQ